VVIHQLKISEELVTRIKDANDIVDVISESVKLRRAGKNYIGLCPFHNEKSPSFSVSSEKQIFKCFGCGEAGNAISFVMKNKNLSFYDAVKYLGDRVNIQVVLDDKSEKVENQKDIIFKINTDTARFFFNNLNNDKFAKNYLKQRKITDATIRHFGLGFAQNSWHSLMNFLKSKGYTELDMIKAGVVVKNNNGKVFDRFRNRIIYPVFNYSGKVIGFGGRVMDDSKPKYLNSPETIVFQKGINLYGLNFAIKHNNNNRKFIIVEGYMDCISLHQAGIENVVASLGTALTQEQAKLLKRYCDKIIMCYDADFAGQNATNRGIDILRDVGLEVNVLNIPMGKDPDEYIKLNGKESFMKLCEEAKPFLEYRIDKAKNNININNNNDVMEYIKNVVAILKDANPVEKDIYGSKVASELNIRQEAIHEMLGNTENVKNTKKVNNYEDFRSKLYIEPAYLKSERILLKMMFGSEAVRNLILNNLSEDDIILNSHKKIFLLILEAINQNNKDIQNYVCNKCDDAELIKEWVKIDNLNLIDSNIENEKLIEDYINELKKYKIEKAKNEIKQKIKEYEKKGMMSESLQEAKKLLDLQKKEFDS
jgi:DNA primase